MSIWPIDDPSGAHAADALLAAPGNDVDQSDDGYPWDDGPCPDCGAVSADLCTCRPGGPRPDLDDPDLDRVVTLHVYDEVDIDMIERVF